MLFGMRAFILFVLYTLLYCRRHVHRPQIYTNSPIIKRLRLKVIYPFYLIPFGFPQSVYQLFRRVQIIKECVCSSIILKISGEAEILIDIYEPYHGHPCSSIRDNIVLVHGLNGSSRSTYIKGMANVFLKKNCRVFCYNARGTLHPPKSDRFCHHGLTSDLQYTVEYILDNYDGSVSLIGFSLGSNWVAKLMGEYTNNRIRLGIAVCCPFDFSFLTSYFKNNYYSQFINYYMCRNYKRYIRRSMLNPINLDNCVFLDEIDTTLLCIFEKGNLEEFYTESSCAFYIDKIDKPMLFINTDDDPVIPKQVIPIKTCLANENVGVVVLKGGHLGFFTNQHETTAEIIASEFFDKVREHGDNLENGAIAGPCEI